jgi:hypothetical protein
MRRNIFTSYIIRNRLNLETFFKPIIDFIEIGGTPPRELYMRLSSRTAQAKHQNTNLNGYLIESLKPFFLNFKLNFLRRYEYKREKSESFSL